MHWCWGTGRVPGVPLWLQAAAGSEDRLRTCWWLGVQTQGAGPAWNISPSTKRPSADFCGLPTERGRLPENVNMPHGGGGKEKPPNQCRPPRTPCKEAQWRDFWARHLLIAQCQSPGGSHRP